MLRVLFVNTKRKSLAILIRMPRINPPVMIACLSKLHSNITEVWAECKNNELSDILKEQIDYIEAIMKTIEKM